MTSGSAPYPPQPAASTPMLPSMASSCAKIKRGSYQSRQRRMGPAPFASFEDLSDELESPDEGRSQRALLPGIREDSVGAGLGQEEVGVNLLAAAVGLQTPSTPRIDISRASSSSQHEESGGSSGGAGGGSPEGRDPLAAGLAAGFKEEGAAELRSSTEELDYHGGGSSNRHQGAHHMVQQHQEPRRRSAERMTSPSSAKYELDTQSDKERKDSGCSEGPLLLGVVGRSSRLSSVGSAGSGASGMSGLSVTSALSGAASSSGMRSPSPHKMLLETSFCGSKPIPTKSMEIEDAPVKLQNDSVEKLKKEGAFEGHAKPVTLDLVAEPTCSSASPQLPAGVGTKQMTPSSSTQSCQSVSRAVSSQQSSVTSGGTKSVSSTPSVSPKLSRHAMWKKGTTVEGSPVAEDVVQSPSPATSRKSSFTGLFGRRSDSGNLLSPESPTVGSVSAMASSTKHRGSKGAISAAIGGLRDRSRSRSKSREHVEQTGLSVAQVSSPNTSASTLTSPTTTEPKTKKESSRNKGVFSSFFKKKDKSKKLKIGSSSGGGPTSLGDTASEGDPLSPDTLSPDTDGKILAETIGNVEFTFNGTVGFQKSDYSMVATEKELKSGEVTEKEHAKVIENIIIGELEGESLLQKTSLVMEEDEKDKPEPEADLFGETVDTSAMQPTEAEHHSSESEREVEYLHSKHKVQDELLEEQCNEDLTVELDHERKGLVLQQDSFEDELPYIPTTLPQERSVALPIKPVRQRTLAEIKTCPIDRPRSTTPINPCALEEFLVAASSSLKAPSSSSGSSSVEDRLRICLPREDSMSSSDAPTLPPRSRSPRAPTPISSWVQFTEDGIIANPHEVSQRNHHKGGRTSSEDPVKHSASPPPPLPPRGFQPAPPKQWVNFEEIPEKRKTPKKLHDSVERSGRKSVHPHRMVYSYVNPEDCKCECHDTGRLGDIVQHGGGEKVSDDSSLKVTRPESSFVADVERLRCEGGGEGGMGREVSRLDVDNLTDRHSYQSDSSCECPNSCSVDQRDAEFSSEGLLKPMKPFGMDLDVSSNRSSIISQDEPVSPDNDPPNQEVLLQQ